jgi:F-type H+-transporting ATPase subunit epsilon
MTLHFELVTPEKLYRSGDAHMVVVPGTEGDFGVMAGHAPVMSTLRADATLQIYASAGAAPEVLTISGGFAEVNDKGLTILAEAVAESA